MSSNAATRPSKTAQPRNLKVLSVGSNPELLWLREAVLQAAGFKVFTTDDPKVAAEKIQTADCGTLLICYSLEDTTRRQLAEEFRKTCPDARIVVITNKPMEGPPIEADTFVYGVEGPEVLIKALRQS